MLQHLRERWRAAQAGDAPEFGQTKIRLWFGVLIVPYFVSVFLRDALLDESDRINIFLIGSYYVISVAVLGWALARPGVNESRRRFAALLDMGATSLIMARTEEAGSVMYGMYLWVMI